MYCVGQSIRATVNEILCWGSPATRIASIGYAHGHAGQGGPGNPEDISVKVVSMYDRYLFFAQVSSEAPHLHDGLAVVETVERERWNLPQTEPLDIGSKHAVLVKRRNIDAVASTLVQKSRKLYRLPLGAARLETVY